MTKKRTPRTSQELLEQGERGVAYYHLMSDISKISKLITKAKRNKWHTVAKSLEKAAYVAVVVYHKDFYGSGE